MKLSQLSLMFLTLVPSAQAATVHGFSCERPCVAIDTVNQTVQSLSRPEGLGRDLRSAWRSLVDACDARAEAAGYGAYAGVLIRRSWEIDASRHSRAIDASEYGMSDESSYAVSESYSTEAFRKGRRVRYASVSQSSSAEGSQASASHGSHYADYDTGNSWHLRFEFAERNQAGTCVPAVYDEYEEEVPFYEGDLPVVGG